MIMWNSNYDWTIAPTVSKELYQIFALLRIEACEGDRWNKWRDYCYHIDLIDETKARSISIFFWIRRINFY